MTEQTNSTQKATEKVAAIKFVVAVLQEHEKELDRLISKLSELTAQLHETDKMSKRIDEIDEKIDTLRKELSVVVKCLFNDEQNRRPT